MSIVTLPYYESKYLKDKDSSIESSSKYMTMTLC